MKKAYIFLAEGFEEIEAVTPLDLLRRKGIDAKFISISGKKEVVGSHKITYIADELFENVDFSDGDAFILPGGMPGTVNLSLNKELKELILQKHNQKKLICAICAGPTILGQLNILKNIEATVYPSLEHKLLGAKPSEKNVCVEENIITAKALGSSIEFSLAIVEKLLSSDEKMSLSKEIVYEIEG